MLAASRCRKQFPQWQYAPAIIKAYSHDCMEVIVHKNHVRCLLAHICAILPHSNTNISLLESHAIIDAIAGHSDDDTAAL